MREALCRSKSKLTRVEIGKLENHAEIWPLGYAGSLLNSVSLFIPIDMSFTISTG